MQLIDIGVNLTNARLYHKRLDHQANAIEAGVCQQIITGTCLDTSRKAAEICDEDPAYYSATAGCHPHDAKDFSEQQLGEFRKLLSLPQVVAVGECGLDFNRNYSPQDIQQKVFRQQIELAIELRMPLFMHQRDAHATFIEILKPYASDITGGVVHCFTGTQQEMADYIDMGLHVGITGWLCDERRGDDLREAVKHTPLDKLLLETDAPYLLPRTIRPRPKSNTNVPAHLPWVLNEMAMLLDMPATDFADMTSRNARQLFKLVQAD